MVRAADVGTAAGFDTGGFAVSTFRAEAVEGARTFKCGGGAGRADTDGGKAAYVVAAATLDGSSGA